MDYSTMTDAELDNIRKSMPKYLNAMTPEQQVITQAVYSEQKKRYDERRTADYEQYNSQVEAAGIKVGDKVSYFAVSMLGFGGIEIAGKVAKRKKYYVKLDAEVNGKKTAHLTKAWRIEK